MQISCWQCGTCRRCDTHWDGSWIRRAGQRISPTCAPLGAGWAWSNFLVSGRRIFLDRSAASPGNVSDRLPSEANRQVGDSGGSHMLSEHAQGTAQVRSGTHRPWSATRVAGEGTCAVLLDVSLDFRPAGEGAHLPNLAAEEAGRRERNMVTAPHGLSGTSDQQSRTPQDEEPSRWGGLSALQWRLDEPTGGCLPSCDVSTRAGDRRSERRGLAHWFAKTATVLNTAQNYRLMIPRGVRHAVKHGVPRDIGVFLGRMPKPPDQLAFAQQAGQVIGIVQAELADRGVELITQAYVCVIRVAEVVGAVVYAAPNVWAKPRHEMVQLHPWAGETLRWEELPAVEEIWEPLTLCGDHPAVAPIPSR